MTAHLSRTMIQLPLGQYLQYRLRGDFGRTKIIGTKLANIDMFLNVERERFVVLWNTEVGRGFVFCR